MKNKQYSLKILETSIVNEEKFIAFFDANYMLFKDHLISIKGDLSDNVKKYLLDKKLIYVNNMTLPQGRSRKALEEEIHIHKTPCESEEYKKLEAQLAEERKDNAVNQQIAKSEIAQLHRKLAHNFTVIDSIIRSGREVNIDGDLLLLNRVNSGATINTTGNLIITKVVEGAVRCNGNFMMITVSPKANIIFNGVEVDNELLTDKLNRIELKNREIFITPVLKKEITWVQ